MLTKMHDLAFEFVADGSLDLEQDLGSGEVHRVTLHPVHLRYLAEQAGLIPRARHDDPDRTIARLSRQLRALHGRIKLLDEWLYQAMQKGHEDLDMETTYSMATLELADEFMADLEGLGAKSNDPESGGIAHANPPKSEGIARTNPPKSGAVGTAGDGDQLFGPA